VAGFGSKIGGQENWTMAVGVIFLALNVLAKKD
jgi:hypothetical protein